jgi:hypothetical protein
MSRNFLAERSCIEDVVTDCKAAGMPESASDDAGMVPLSESKCLTVVSANVWSTV